MNFETTNQILEKIDLYIANSNIKTVTEENKDFKGRKYKSDFVIIDEENNVGFEILDNEIIVFYFTDHQHFEDYTSELQDGEDDYKKRALGFLKGLFENRIKKIEIFKGKKLCNDKYYIVYSDDTQEFIGGTYWSLIRMLNPFTKREEKMTLWQFDSQRGHFEKN